MTWSEIEGDGDGCGLVRNGRKMKCAQIDFQRGIGGKKKRCRACGEYVRETNGRRRMIEGKGHRLSSNVAKVKNSGASIWGVTLTWSQGRQTTMEGGGKRRTVEVSARWSKEKIHTLSSYTLRR